MSLRPWKTVVVVPPTSTDLTRVDTVMRELNIKNPTEDDRALMLERIRRASAEVTSYCQRQFARQTVTDYFRPTRIVPSDDRAVYFSLTPVVEILSSLSGADAVDVSGYQLGIDTGALSLGDAWPTWFTWPSPVFSVTYVGGYLLMDDLPRDLEQAVIDLVKTRVFAGRRDPYVVSESVPGVLSTEYRIGEYGSEGLPPDVKSILDRYRRYTI